VSLAIWQHLPSRLVAGQLGRVLLHTKDLSVGNSAHVRANKVGKSLPGNRKYCLSVAMVVGVYLTRPSFTAAI
jgi:hypothetical protein